MTTAKRDAGGAHADAWHAAADAAAAAVVVDDVANVAGAAEMTSRSLRAGVYTCDK